MRIGSPRQPRTSSTAQFSRLTTVEMRGPRLPRGYRDAKLNWSEPAVERSSGSTEFALSYRSPEYCTPVASIRGRIARRTDSGRQCQIATARARSGTSAGAHRGTCETSLFTQALHALWLIETNPRFPDPLPRQRIDPPDRHRGWLPNSRREAGHGRVLSSTLKPGTRPMNCRSDSGSGCLESSTAPSLHSPPWPPPPTLQTGYPSRPPPVYRWSGGEPRHRARGVPGTVWMGQQ